MTTKKIFIDFADFKLALYRKTYDKCDGYNDDRALFRRTYDILHELVEEAKALNKTTTMSFLFAGAISEKLSENAEELERLVKSLEERDMI